MVPPEAASSSSAPVVAMEERPAKAPRLGKGKGKGKEIGKSRHGAPYVWNVGFKDLVWTPEMQRKKESEKSKENALAWALYKAVEMHGGQNVTLSQLGSDFKVAELKKDAHFKNWRLLDILKEYEDVFELTPSASAAGGMIVRLQPGAEAALPDAESRAEQVNDESLMLPDRIENPRTMVEKVQAFRIELLHALQRRGGKCAIQELGQEPRLQEKKKLLHQAKKLVDWVKIFPSNFLLFSDGQQMVVEVLSADVSETRMIDRAIGRREEQERSVASSTKSSRNNQSQSSSQRDSGRDRDRDRSDRGRYDRRDRDRDRFSSISSYGAFGRSPYEAPPMHPAASSYGMPPPAYGYGPPAQQPPPSAPGYGAPPAGHYGGYPGQPPPAYPQLAGYAASQPSHYPPASTPAPAGYQQPSGYQQPPAYQQPAAGYQQQPGYQQPAPASYQQPAPAPYQQQASYPPPASSYGAPPPAAASYPPPQAPAGGYPPPHGGGYPPPASGYPPPGGGYPPPSGYPPPAY
mmetsp:Transcript_117900/g.294075  ORF Transcript_117900/g.294075 Transcript_117900/m.294075 type:complete len:518 (+) Transcript_117900:2-1555(+)